MVGHLDRRRRWTCSFHIPLQKILLLALLKVLVFLVYQGTKPTCGRRGCESGTGLLQSGLCWALSWLVQNRGSGSLPCGAPQALLTSTGRSHLQWLGVLCLCPPTPGASFLPSLPEPFETFLGISAFRGIPGLQPVVPTLGGALETPDVLGKRLYDL